MSVPGQKQRQRAPERRRGRLTPLYHFAFVLVLAGGFGASWVPQSEDLTAFTSPFHASEHHLIALPSAAASTEPAMSAALDRSALTGSGMDVNVGWGFDFSTTAFEVVRDESPAVPEAAAADTSDSLTEIATPEHLLADKPPGAFVPVLPTPTPPPPPPPSPLLATRADLEAALAASRWPAETWSTVITIAMCESGNGSTVNTQAIGGGGLYYCVLQIAVGIHVYDRPLNLLELNDNLDAGYQVWMQAGQSWGPWGGCLR